MNGIGESWRDQCNCKVQSMRVVGIIGKTAILRYSCNVRYMLGDSVRIILGREGFGGRLSRSGRVLTRSSSA